MATKYKFPDRDPADQSDATFDFTDFLETGVIQTASVTVDIPGLTVTGNLVGPKMVTTMLSGGVVGTTYTLSCTITLVDGRQFNRSARVAVKDL